MASSEHTDTWDPLEDPTGNGALKRLNDRLTVDERRLLRELSVGQRLREIEVDRLSALGVAERDELTAEPRLTQLGSDVLRGVHGPGPAGD